MKATKLIDILASLIDLHGDLEVTVDNYGVPLKDVSFHPVTYSNLNEEPKEDPHFWLVVM